MKSSTAFLRPCFLFGGLLFAAIGQASLIQPAGPREKLSFNPGWLFFKGDATGAEQPAFDDSSWTPVGLPHTYNETDTFDDWSPSGHRGEMNQWGGKTWYRKHFEVPAAWAGRLVRIEFESVRQVADVWLNGHYLGKSENGFVPFGFDLTPYLNLVGNNVLALRCDNSFATDNTSGVTIEYPNTGDAKFPWNNPHWHPAHGGIYRNVFLHLSGAVHVTLPLYSSFGTTGTYVYAKNISRASAEVTVEAQVGNSTDGASDVTTSCQILNAAGAVVASWENTRNLAAGEMYSFSDTRTVASPQLWEPGYPYLYTARVIVFAGGVESDGVDTTFGIRRMVHNKYTGFFINDRYVKLRGWGQKPTDEWAGLGSALPNWMHHLTLKMMQEAGGNFVRWGHCAGGPAQIESGDQLGLLTIQPGVDGEADTTGHAWDVRASAFRDVIVYFRNSPSIFIWEGGNQSVTVAHVRQLRGYFDAFDPHGGRSYAHRRANATIEPWLDLSISTEGSGYLTDLPTVEGEYNREEAPRRVWDRATPPYASYHATGTYDLTAEEFALNQATQFEKIAPRAHGGGGNWIFTDSTSGGRVQSEVTRTSGEVDAVRLPKEAYYVTKVLFRRDPQVHIIGHWNYPAGTIKTMWVSSNQNEVELFLNDESLGRESAHSSSPYLFHFDSVHFSSGTLRVVAYGEEGTATATQLLPTTGEAVALRITPIAGPDGFVAHGGEVCLFDVEAIDADERRVPTYNGRVDFALSGPAVWRGGYNSGKRQSTNNLWLDLESGINRVAIRSTALPGTVSLTATAAGLSAGEAEVVALADGGASASGAYSPNLPAMPDQEPLSPLSLPPAQDRIDSLYDGTAPIGSSSRFFENTSYSGPGGSWLLVSAPHVGSPATSDAAFEITALPAFLSGGEMMIFPQADAAYSAVDLAQMDILETTSIYLAHDTAIATPAWVLERFLRTTHKVEAGGHTYSLYRAWFPAGSTLLLESNQNVDTIHEAGMMMVFAPGRTNVALKAVVTSSSQQTETGKVNLAAYAADGSHETRWAASDGTFPQWIDFDLGVPVSISAIRMRPYLETERFSRYMISARDEGGLYTVVADRSTNTEMGPQEVELGGVQARNFRVTILSTSAGWASMHEIELLLGTGDNSDPQSALTHYALGQAPTDNRPPLKLETEVSSYVLRWQLHRAHDLFGLEAPLQITSGLEEWEVVELPPIVEAIADTPFSEYSVRVTPILTPRFFRLEPE